MLSPNQKDKRPSDGTCDRQDHSTLAYGQMYSANLLETGATPVRIHSAKVVKLLSIVAALASDLAVVSGVSIDNIRMGMRIFGVSPSETSTSDFDPSDGKLTPAGLHSICVFSNI